MFFILCRFFSDLRKEEEALDAPYTEDLWPHGKNNLFFFPNLGATARYLRVVLVSTRLVERHELVQDVMDAGRYIQLLLRLFWNFTLSAGVRRRSVRQTLFLIDCLEATGSLSITMLAYMVMSSRGPGHRSVHCLQGPPRLYTWHP